MSYYHGFHFTARLGRHTPPGVLNAVEVQFTPLGDDWDSARRSGEDHPFFSTERGNAVPHATNQEVYAPPTFVRQALGGALVSFTCQINYGADTIEAFLDWIAPYVVRRGKRLRGRTKIGVGYWWGEDRHNKAVLPLSVPVRRRTSWPLKPCEDAAAARSCGG